MKDFFLRLQKCAEEKGVTQSEVAKAINAPAGSVSRYFTGVVLPKSAELYALAKYFGVSMEWLLVGDEARDPEALRVQEEAVIYGARRKVWMKDVVDGLEALKRKVEEAESKED